MSGRGATSGVGENSRTDSCPRLTRISKNVRKFLGNIKLRTRSFLQRVSAHVLSVFCAPKFGKSSSNIDKLETILGSFKVTEGLENYAYHYHSSIHYRRFRDKWGRLGTTHVISTPDCRNNFVSPSLRLDLYESSSSLITVGHLVQSTQLEPPSPSSWLWPQAGQTLLTYYWQKNITGRLFPHRVDRVSRNSVQKQLSLMKYLHVDRFVSQWNTHLIEIFNSEVIPSVDQLEVVQFERVNWVTLSQHFLSLAAQHNFVVRTMDPRNAARIE